MRPGAIQRLMKALVVERLQEIIESVHVERLQGELVVGGDEYHHGGIQPVERGQQLEAGQPWNLNVQKQEIRVQLADGSQRLGSVTALGDDLDVFFLLEQRGEAGPSKGFVIYDDRTDTVHVCAPAVEEESSGVSLCWINDSRALSFIQKRPVP